MYFEDPILTKEGASKHINQLPHANIHFINENKEVKETNKPTPTTKVSFCIFPFIE